MVVRVARARQLETSLLYVRPVPIGKDKLLKLVTRSTGAAAASHNANRRNNELALQIQANRIEVFTPEMALECTLSP
jgi:hypothetical protein